MNSDKTRPGLVDIANKPGKVLLVGNFLGDIRKYGSVGEDLAVGLAHKGWTVITTSHEPLRLSRLFDMLRSIWVARRRYDVAHVDIFSGPAFLWAEATCWLLVQLHKPLILTLRGGALPEFAERWPNRVRRVLRWAKTVTAPSEYLASQMKKFREDIIVLPNPLKVTQTPFRLRDKPSPNLMWLRAFHSIYNPCLAPQVLSELLHRFPDSKLTMIGPDKGDGSLEATRRQAERLGVLDRINFVGAVPRSDVTQWLHKGDVFINTTDIDNTPVSVLEAMACGLCVVSTDVGGLPYLLQNNIDALLVRPGDAAAMSKAVQRVLSEPELAAKLSTNGRHKAEEFDWAAILPQWESLFQMNM